MNKLVLAILLLCVAALAWFLLLDDDATETWDPNDAADFDTREDGDPTLLGAEGAGPRPERAAGPTKSKSERDQERREASMRTWLQGIVVAEDGGSRISGAVLSFELAGSLCPRIPRTSMLPVIYGLQAGPTGAAGSAGRTVRTDKSGRFIWRVPAERLPSDGEFDLFVEAKGCVTGVVCRPSVGADLTVRLKRAIHLQARVTDRHRRPLEGARVSVRPAEGTPAIPGHAGAATTDREGACDIDGLLPGDLMISADHPEYMPQTFGPIDPAKIDSYDFELAPALRLTFEIRSDDGSAIENPVLTWKTDGSTPASDLQLLKVSASGPPAQPTAEVKSTPVRIPCTDRNVQLELKADGFQPWRPQPEPLPVDGGARTIIASLSRDVSLAPLKISFQDPEGKAVTYRDLNAKLEPPMALDGQAVGAITLEVSETLDFPSLPAGRYRFGIHCAKYAPAVFEVQLVAGETNTHTVKLTEPARLRVRFTAPERLMVGFRILHEERPVPSLFRIKEDGSPSEAGVAVKAGGAEGALFGGLPAGTVTVQVTSENLVASSTQVALHAGETTDVEIEVQPR